VIDHPAQPISIAFNLSKCIIDKVIKRYEMKISLHEC
jgi:hypothetical protein